jgi:UDP-N-acetylmuramoyl-tripeptide--D-alanyl-D-alanine ligase
MERRIDWIVEVTGGVLYNTSVTDKWLVAIGVSTDTRTIQTGNLYVPLVGEVFDGHQFTQQAESLGAVAALWQADIPLPDVSIPLIVVPDTLVALQELAARYRTEVGCKVVAITGSNGKTTTKSLVATVLSTVYSVHKTAGNLNNHIGLPLTILSMPAITEVMVLEMGMNHLGEIAKLSQIARPDIAIITNIGESHIGILGSREKIAAAKLEICEGLEENGILLVDGDEPLLHGAGPNGNSIPIGWDRHACYEAPLEVEMIGLIGWRFTSLQTGYKYNLPLLGRHNVKNACFAIEVGRRLRVPEDKIVQGLSQVPAIPMRLEVVQAKNGMKIINDAYNASPSSMYAALNMLTEVEPTLEKWALLAGIEELGDLETHYHHQVGEYVVRKGITKLITVGEKGYFIYEATKQVSSDQIEFTHFDTNEEASAYLLAEGNKQILLLVKASRKAGLDRIVKQLVEGA